MVERNLRFGISTHVSQEAGLCACRRDANAGAAAAAVPQQAAAELSGVPTPPVEPKAGGQLATGNDVSQYVLLWAGLGE